MRHNRLDLNQLQVLDSLLTTRSATRVAEQMGLTQPAISGILRRLRDYFGDDLFVQSGRRMQPTPFAEGLGEAVRDMLFKADIVSRMRPEADLATLKRSVRIAVSDFVAAVLLAPVFRTAAVEAPNLRFDLFSIMDSRRNYHEDLDRGDVDLLLVPEAFASPGSPSAVILREDFVCIACLGNTTLEGRLDLAAYLAAGHVVLANRPGVALPYQELQLARMGYSRRIEIAAPSFLTIPEFVIGSQRIATVHAGLAAYFGRRWPIQILPCPAPIPPMVEVMQWHAYHDRDPAIGWLRRAIVEQARRLT